MATQNIKNYTNLYQNNQETLTLMKFLLLKLGFYFNDQTTTKNSKKYNFSGKLIEEIQILKETIKANNSETFSLKTEQKLRQLNLKEKKKQLDQFNINLPGFKSNFSNLFNLKNNYSIKLTGQNSILI